MDDDSVKQIKAERFRKANEFQEVLNTGNYEILHNYISKQTLDFAAEVTELQKNSQPALNKINERLHQQENRYLLLYVLAAFFFTLDRIRKQRSKES